MEKKVKKEDDYSSYCYDLVASKINIGAESAIALGGNSQIMGWSPNNIRRLVVSPDGFLVQYHTNSADTKNRKLIDIVLFRDRSKLEKCFSSSGYKPMVTTLVGSRICSSVEEIVYLTKQGESGLVLPRSEADVNKLVTGYKSSLGDIYTVLGSRFVRLKSLITLNLTLQEFYKTYGGNLKENMTQLSDIEAIGKSSKTIKEIWWKSTYLRGTHYTPDVEGGVLDRHFSAILESKEKELRDAKLASIKQGTTSVNKELVRADSTLAFMRKAFAGLYNTLEDSKLYANAPHGISQELLNLISSSTGGITLPNSATLCPEVSTDNLEFVGMYTEAVQGGSSTAEDKGAIVYAFNRISVLLYRAIVSFTLSSIVKFGGTYPVFVRTKLADVDRNINIPDGLSALAIQAGEFLGGVPSGVQQKSSIANCLYILGLLFVSEGVVKDKSKYTKEYWLGILDKRSDK